MLSRRDLLTDVMLAWGAGAGIRDGLRTRGGRVMGVGLLVAGLRGLLFIVDAVFIRLRGLVGPLEIGRWIRFGAELGG